MAFKLGTAPVEGLRLQVAQPGATELVYPVDSGLPFPGSIRAWIGRYAPATPSLEATVSAFVDQLMQEALRRLGTRPGDARCSDLACLDGNLLVTPTEAIAVINRLGYVRNNSVIETGVSGFASSSRANSHSTTLRRGSTISTHRETTSITPGARSMRRHVGST